MHDMVNTPMRLKRKVKILLRLERKLEIGLVGNRVFVFKERLISVQLYGGIGVIWLNGFPDIAIA